MVTNLTDKQREAISALDPLDGVAAVDMEVVSVERVAVRREIVKGKSQPCKYGYQVDLRHPAHGVILATIEDGVASWPYLGTLCEVNGIVYSTLAKARRVREALAAEGIPNESTCSRAATLALRKHGVERVPKVGEEWGCGCEFGTIERCTADSRAVIRQTKRDGLVAIGQTFELPIHVLSVDANKKVKGE